MNEKKINQILKNQDTIMYCLSYILKDARRLIELSDNIILTRRLLNPKESDTEQKIKESLKE